MRSASAIIADQIVADELRKCGLSATVAPEFFADRVHHSATPCEQCSDERLRGEVRRWARDRSGADR